MHANLALVMLAHHTLSGTPEDLDQAVNLLHDAVEATPAAHPERGARTANLAVALHTAAISSGDPDTLDEALNAARAAVTTARAGTPDHALRLSNLGPILRSRYDRNGAVDDLDDAIAALRDAVAAAAPDHPDQPARLSNLGDLLRVRCEHQQNRADLDEAVTLHTHAVSTGHRTHPDRPGHLSNFGSALQSRAHLAELHGADPSADLDHAIAALSEAVELNPPDAPNRYLYLTNLGNALLTAGKIDAAVGNHAMAETVVPAGHAARATVLRNLANSLERRFERDHNPRDLEHAITAARSAAADSTSPALQRLVAAWSWADLAVRRHQDIRDGSRAMDAALSLADVAVYVIGTTVEDRAQLRRFAGLASDAAAIAMANSQLVDALTRLEHGRGITWRRNGIRDVAAQIRERNPAVAGELERIRGALDNPPLGPMPVVDRATI